MIISVVFANTRLLQYLSSLQERMSRQIEDEMNHLWVLLRFVLSKSLSTILYHSSMMRKSARDTLNTVLLSNYLYILYRMNNSQISFFNVKSTFRNHISNSYEWISSIVVSRRSDMIGWSTRLTLISDHIITPDINQSNPAKNSAIKSYTGLLTDGASVTVVFLSIMVRSGTSVNEHPSCSSTPFYKECEKSIHFEIDARKERKKLAWSRYR